MQRPKQTAIALVEDRTAEGCNAEGFLRLRRVRLINTNPDGVQGNEYRYDVVERPWLDAVVIVLYANVDGEVLVCMRASLRPPLAFRSNCSTPEPADDETVIWEVPAGLIEADEVGDEGIARCASRETLEEAGFTVSPQSFSTLGEPTYLCPGVIPERLYFMCAEVDPSTRGEPTEDGSEVEAGAEVRMVPLRQLAQAIDEGVICDAKTEVAIRRLMARLRSRP
ncbi:MAG: NUDIX hydrolase [Polyangiales bacterium]